jgi:cytochrome c2
MNRHLLLILACAAVLLTGCHRRNEAYRQAQLITQGDPDQGKELIGHYGCAGCHVIPGIDGATSTTGPSLAGVADRKLIAGQFENQPETMMKWLRNPKLYDPHSGMSNMGITEKESRDIAAYLYTLKGN